MRTVVFLAAAALLLAVVSTAAAESRHGAPFGNNRYHTELRSGGTPDVDDYVSGLVAGEVLSVSVTADRGTELLPTLALIDPEGTDRTPVLKSARGGAALSFKKFAVDRTGRWTVRIAGANGTFGNYTVRFGVKPAPPVRLKRNAVGGEEPVERTHSIDGVEGAVLVAEIKSRTPTVPAVTSVLGPSLLPVVVPGGELKGRKRSYDDVALDEGDGAYDVTVAIEEGEAEYDIELSLAHPQRPTGTIELSGTEPRVLPVLVPFTGNSKTVFRISGSNFTTTVPRPRVFFGDVEATVLTVDAAGTYINVGPPDAAPGTVVCVAVQNADGQAVVVPDYFEYVEVDQADLASITPNSVTLYVGALQTYTLTLDRPAPSGGVSVGLETDGGIGDVPAALAIPAFSNSAQFQLAASGNPTTGSITATLRGASLAASVTLVALPGGGGGDPPPPLPDEIDISGYVVRQTDDVTKPTPTIRDYVFPAGTKLKAGDYVVLARSTTKSNFEAYWGVTLGPGVLFVDGTNSPTSNGDDWPSINGNERFALGAYTKPGDKSTFTAAGPATIAMPSGGGSAYSRFDLDGAADDPAAWTTNGAGPGNGSTPGGGHSVGAVKHGLVITEFADVPSGNSQYFYEYVELFFDGLKP